MKLSHVDLLLSVLVLLAATPAYGQQACTRVLPGPAFPRYELLAPETVKFHARLPEGDEAGFILLRNFPSGSGPRGYHLQRVLPDGEGGLAPGELTRISSSYGFPMVLSAGNLDGDGHADALLLSWCWGSSSPICLNYYRGRADGTFEPAREWRPDHGEALTFPLLADFDGDGRDEVAFVFSELSSLLLLEIDESSQWRVVTSTRMSSIHRFPPSAVADWNNDGIADLSVLAGSASTAAFTVALGDRDMPFAVRTRYWLPYSARKLDSLNDKLLAIEFSGAWPHSKISAIHQIGESSLGGVHESWVQVAPDNTQSVGSQVDIDGDGLDDLRLQQSSHAHLYWGESSGPPSAGPRTTTTATFISSLDLNADGVHDFVTDDWAALIQHEPRKIIEGLHMTTVFEGLIRNPYTFLDIGDINNDGLDDVVAETFRGDSLNIGLARGDGSFEIQALEVDPSDIVFPMLIDADRDGHLDLVAGRHGRSSAWGLGDGSFAMQLEPYENKRRLVGDLDGRKGLDLVEFDRESDLDKKILLRTALGHERGWIDTDFEVEYPDDRYLDHVLLADLDGDHLDDLVQMEIFDETDRDRARVVWWRSLGDGSFDEPLPVIDMVFETCSGTRMEVTDFDRDGTADLFLQPGIPASCINPEYSSLRGLGGGRFELIWRGPPTHPDSYDEDRLLDIDADGRPDLVWGRYSSHYLAKYHVEIRRGDGLGGFLPKEPIVWRGPAGKTGVFRHSGTRDLIALKYPSFGWGSFKLELFPSSGHVLPADAAPPTVELRLVPDAPGSWRPALLPLDECDSAPQFLGAHIALPSMGEGYLLSYEPSEASEILVFESSDGARRGALLRGPERNAMLELWRDAHTRGGFPVRHMLPIRLAVLPASPGLATSALPGLRLIQRIELAGGRVIEAEAYGPDADLFFVMEAMDRSGKTGRSKASFLEAIVAGR